MACFCIAMSTDTRAQDAGSEAIVPQLNPLAGFDPSSLKDFLERPLFSPTRQPPQAPVVADPAPAAAAVESTNFRLLGILETPRGLIARLADLDSGNATSLRKDDTYRDWTVVAIDTASLTLSRDGKTIDLAIFRRDANPPPAASTAAEPQAEAIDPQRPVRVIPGATEAPPPASPQWTEQDLTDVFGTKRGADEKPDQQP